MYASVSKLKVVAGSLKVTGSSLKVIGSSLVRRHVGSLSVDELADLKEFQLEHEDDYHHQHADALSGVQTAEVRPFEEIPGPRGLPLIGNMLSYSKYGEYSFEKILDNRMSYMRRYGKIYKEKLGPMWMVHLFDPTDLATMFRLEGRYPSRGKIAGIEVSYLQRNNKLVGFAFRFLDLQMPVARDFAEILGKTVDSSGVVPNLYDKLFQYTMESIAAVCFGERIGAFDKSGEVGEVEVAPRNDDARQLSAAIAETFVCFRATMFNFPWYRLFRTPTYQRFERAANTMRQIMGKYVEAAQQHTRRRPAMSRLMTSSCDVTAEPGACPFSGAVNSANDADDDEVGCVLDALTADPRVSTELAVNLVMALFRTGIDSTGNALSFFLHNLASNPDKQDQLYSEIQQFMPDTDTVPTGDTLQKMVYLKAYEDGLPQGL